MNLRSMKTHAVGTAAVLALVTITEAQVSSGAQASSASHVAAEMTKGKLSPAQSKPGDTVALKLKDDLKSNGQLVLKKGTLITGVVRNVMHEAKGHGQSMMEIEWIVPEPQERSARDLSLALQSVVQIYQHEQNSDAPDDLALTGSSSSTAVARSATAGGGLLGGIAGSVTTVAHTSGQSNPALLNMPTVVAVDHQTSSAIEGGLGSSSSGQLFKVGHGELVSAGGSQQSVDLFSHLNNDTVITSPSKNFEITSGAQMQLLVGVNKK